MEPVVIVVGGVLYLAPTFLSAARGHHNSTAIFLLNLFLGWTVIGWVAALVWAATAVRSGRLTIPLRKEPEWAPCTAEATCGGR
jgi:Superinfection immunity protein